MTHAVPYHDYAEVPWYRKSNTNSAVLFLQLLTRAFFPVSLCVCIVLLTGDVYYNQKDTKGDLKRWGFANKIAAVLLFVACLAILIYHPF